MLLAVDHPNTLVSVSKLALAFKYQGRYSEAEGLHRHTPEAMNRALQHNRPHTLPNMSNSNWALYCQGDHGGAEKMHRRVLGGPEEPDNTRAPSTTHNLAQRFGRKEKYNETENLRRCALSDWERALGPKHPDTLESARDPAGVSRYGHYFQAVRMNYCTLKR
ncbi:hypothetical protein C7212DRAFT_285351 [Tuber magnatum]|uniref:TPR-like protein n=1 Tax=Tuber magnatum TaxID=42249 RepID=A0A317SHC4_9PEZI|nr:hypothetical protein C7212DRAFT_285351 [Tuber magnatum]